jgi:hypothetical protein
VKKGRHRRFEEARSLKRSIEVTVEPCPECGAGPEDEHASWCLYESEELDDATDGEDGGAPAPVEHRGAPEPVEHRTAGLDD